MDAKITRSLKTITTRDLLEELMRREGTFEAVARAQLLVLKKSEDYNGTESPGALRDQYFPFGNLSYMQMIWTKCLRLKNISEKKDINFESLEDTLLDLINYSSFWIDRIKRDAK